jgi:hypothetical protein
MLTEVIVDSIDISNYVVKWETEELMFEAITTLEVEVIPYVNSLVTIEVGNTITVKRGFSAVSEDFVFDGYVDQIDKTKGNRWTLSCRDKLSDLVKHEITKSFDENIDTEAGVVSDIFLTLVNTYGGGVLAATGVTVQDSSALPNISKFVCDHTDVYERAQVLADLINWQFYFKPDDGLVYFEPKGYLGNYGTITVGDEVSDIPQWKKDGYQLANEITVFGAESEVETTETGQIGVTSGYTTSSIELTKTPTSVKVFSDAANPPTTLRSGGLENSTSNFDYSVDRLNDKIIWNTSQYTPGASDYVEIRYSYKIPSPVIAKNDASKVTYNQTVKKTFSFDDIKDVTDAEARAVALIAKYSTPFISTTLTLSKLIDLRAGQTVRIIDGVNGEDSTLLIQSINKSWPFKGDKLEVGEKRWREEDWEVEVMDKLKRFEEKVTENVQVLTHLLSVDRDINYRRRYLKLQKKTYPAQSADLLIWDSALYGIWGTNKWGDTVSAFLLGSANYGVLGVNKLGDSSGASYSDVRVTQGENTYKEYFLDTIFKDTATTTATWNTGTNELTFTAGQIGQTEPIFLDTDAGDTINTALVTLTNTGTITIELSPDGGSNWESVTGGVIHSFTNVGSELLVRLTEGAATTATATYLEVGYTLS